MRHFPSIYFFMFFVILFSACSDSNPGGVQGRVDLNLANELASKDLGGTTVRLKGKSNTTTTDINGNFSMKNISSGKYTFTVAREDYETVEVDLEIEEYAIVPLNVVLPYSFGVFKGRFSSEEAELKSATLELTDSEGKKNTAEIGNFGVFKFDKLAQGAYNAEMKAEGFTPYVFEIEIEKDKVLDIGNIAL
ncbi:MAG TPA: carboxypeptidase regulatory-like domain-containing protein, partial [bacterium]|nr:carboxypeptidase regulatory-like domain-containing protein [bacterium]